MKKLEQIKKLKIFVNIVRPYSKELQYQEDKAAQQCTNLSTILYITYSFLIQRMQKKTHAHIYS